MGRKLRAGFWGLAGYRPSREQLVMHDCPARLKLIAGGERAGKSYASAMEVLGDEPRTDALYWFVGPTYDLARPEARYVLEGLANVGLLDATAVSWPAHGPVAFKDLLNRRYESKSSDDVLRLAAFAPSLVVMCEAAQQSHEVFLRLRGRVAEKRGRLLLSGTFESSFGWYAEKFTQWQNPDNPDGGASFSIPTWSNRAVYPGGRDDPEIKALAATYPADVFAERFGAVPCPPATLVFPEFRYTVHVRACPFDQQLPTTLWIDPGWSPGWYAVLAVQFHGPEVWIIDEVYVQQLTNAEVISLCQARAWWPTVEGAVIDIAGKTHANAQDAPTYVWRQLTGLHLRARPVGVMAGIDRHRTFLRDSNGAIRLYHDPCCKRTVKEYELYRRPEDAEHRALQVQPIDRDNHAMKAIAYGLVDRYGFVDERAKPVQYEPRNPYGGLV